MTFQLARISRFGEKKGNAMKRSILLGGSFDKDHTPDDMEKMKEMVRIAMEGGAAGISSGRRSKAAPPKSSVSSLSKSESP